MGQKDERRLRGKGCFWEHLHEGMDFHPFEDTELDVGVLLRERLSFLKRIGFDDDQAPCPVRQGSGEHDPALGVERFQPRKVRRPMDFSFCLPIGTVES